MTNVYLSHNRIYFFSLFVSVAQVRFTQTRWFNLIYLLKGNKRSHIDEPEQDSFDNSKDIASNEL